MLRREFLCGASALALAGCGSNIETKGWIGKVYELGGTVSSTRRTLVDALISGLKSGCVAGINTAIEKLADRVNLAIDPQIGRVKDMGSAAVGLALLLAAAAWLLALAERLGLI